MFYPMYYLPWLKSCSCLSFRTSHNLFLLFRNIFLWLRMLVTCLGYQQIQRSLSKTVYCLVVKLHTVTYLSGKKSFEIWKISKQISVVFFPGSNYLMLSMQGNDYRGWHFYRDWHLYKLSWTYHILISDVQASKQEVTKNTSLVKNGGKCI